MSPALRTTQVDRTSKLINFAIGQPDFDLLPHDLLERAARVRFAEGDSNLLNYGFEQGDERFRVALATFLQGQYHQPVDPNRLLVTAGASQALDFIATHYTRPGQTILVEEPSYFIALRIFLEDHRLAARPIPCDSDGMDLGALEDALVDEKPPLLYTIPTFQNPSGRTLSAERRKRLVELALEHDCLIVADEVYHPLAYADSPPPPLASYAETGSVLSVGSFSKILAPGLRLGWIHGGGDHIDRLTGSGLIDSGGGLNHFTSNLVRVVLEAGWQDDYLNQLRRHYRERIEAMDSALNEHLSNHVTWTKPTGGYFFWLRCGEEVESERLLGRAHERGVGFLPGNRASSRGSLSNYIRLSFAHYGPDQIREGIARLGSVFVTHR